LHLLVFACIINYLSKNMPRFLTNEALVTIVPSKERTTF
jgi:hypothetical protein